VKQSAKAIAESGASRAASRNAISVGEAVFIGFGTRQWAVGSRFA
jgi:hypothetical protein